MDTFETSRQRMQLACKITGLSASALAREAGLSQTTITRVFNRSTSNVPSQRTMAKIDDTVKKYLQELSAQAPDEATRLLQLWSPRLIVSSSGGITPFDPALLTDVILGVHKSLRHVWSSVSPDLLAEMIVKGYLEFAANREAGCNDTDDNQGSDTP